MSVLDNYEISSIIGEGTFGVVRLGKEKLTGEKVAIKILEKKKIVTKDDEERVEREIEILKKVNHINVIKTMQIITDKEKIYIIMEFCEKGELFNHIVEEQKLEEDEAAYFYYQLINGLECIHYNGVVHRDLKPENLLISKENILKIIDFGLSNYFSKENLLSTPCGSPCYASPEMVSGQKYDGFMIDIWSTGIILFAMLCGYLPFEDPDNEILFKKILKCDAEFPNDLSNDSVDLMKKIMVTNPKERITLTEIKNHSFYLKGKKCFEKMHPNLVEEVEKIYEERNIEIVKEIKKKTKKVKKHKKKEKKKEEEKEKENVNEKEENMKKEDIKIDSDNMKENVVNEPQFVTEKNEKKENEEENNIIEDNKIIEVKKDDKIEKDSEKKDKVDKIKEKEKEKENEKVLINPIKNKEENEKESNIINEINNKINKINSAEIKNNFYSIDNNEDKNEMINKIPKNNDNLIGQEEDKNKNNKQLNMNLNEEFKTNYENNELNANIEKNTNNEKNNLNINANKVDKLIKDDNLNKDLSTNKKDNVKTSNNNNNYKENKKNETIDKKESKTQIKKPHNKIKINNQNIISEVTNNNNQNKSIIDSNKKIMKKIDVKRKNEVVKDKKNPMAKNIIKKRVNKTLKKNIMTNNVEVPTFSKSDFNEKIRTNSIKDKERYSNNILEHNRSGMNSQRNEKNNPNKNIKIVIEDNNYNSENKKKKEESKRQKPINTTNILVKQTKIIPEKGRKNINNNSSKNSQNIPNLKNKINIVRNSTKEKSNEISKYPKKIKPLLTKKYEIKRYRTPWTKMTKDNNNINNKNISSMYNYKLNINENNDHGINEKILPNKNNISKKENSAINTYTEPQEKKEKKIVNLHNNYIINTNENIEIISHKNENKDKDKENINYNFMRNEKIYSEMLNKNNKTISNSKEKPNRNAHESMKIRSINYIDSVNNNNFSEINDGSLNNYSVRNKNINFNANSQNKNNQSDFNLNDYSHKTKNLNNNYLTGNNPGFNNKTFNKNINIYKIYNNNINNYQNLNTNQDNNDDLYHDINYMRKFDTEVDNYQSFEEKNENINNENIYDQSEGRNIYLKYRSRIPETEYNIDEDKLNFDKNGEYIMDSPKMRNNYNHKKNISNYLYPNNFLKKNEIYNQKIITNSNTEIKSPQNNKRSRELINQIHFNNERRFHNMKTSKNSLRDKKLLNYVSNDFSDIFNIPQRNLTKLNSIRKTETFNHFNNYTNSYIKNSTQNLNQRLGMFSNSVEKYRISNYPNTLTISDLNSPINLYSSHQDINNLNILKNNTLDSRRRIKSSLKNNSYDNNTNPRRTINNNYYYVINKTKFFNPKLVRKGIVLNTTNDNDYHNYNSNLIDDNNFEINRGLYITKSKPNFKYLSNYNLNRNINPRTESKYQFNKTQINLGYYDTNHKINRHNKDFDDNDINEDFQYWNSNNINNIKSFNDITYRQRNEKNNVKNKIIGHLNNRTIIQDNYNKSLINDYARSGINKYKTTNLINTKFSQIINTHLSNRKPNRQLLGNTNNSAVEDLLIKLTKAKNEYKKNKNYEISNLNNNYIKLDNQDITKQRQRRKPISFISSQDLNSGISEKYLINNTNENINHYRINNISDNLMTDTLNNNLNRDRKSIVNKNRETFNFDQNYNYIFNNNNNFYNNNRNLKVNLYGKKFI